MVAIDNNPLLTITVSDKNSFWQEPERLPMQLTSLIEKYVSARKRQGAKPGTIANLRWALDSFSNYIGRRDLRTLGCAHIERWLEDCADYAPASRRAMLSTVRTFLRWAERNKYVSRNPANDVKGPRQPRHLPRALRGGAGARVVSLGCPDARARLIVILMLQQGLRCVEVSRLDLHDIDPYHATIKVTGKGDHERVLPLMDETLGCLNAYLSEHPCKAGPLIRSYTQNRPLTPGSISRLVSGWMIDADVKAAPRDGISAHCCRHTASTDMLLAGSHIRDVQAALGHLHLSSTELYMPLVVRGLDEAMSGRTYFGARTHP